jgi:hypothetical protein
MYIPFFLAIFLKRERYHFGSQRSGSGRIPGFLGSKFFGYFIFLFLRFFGMNTSAPPFISSNTFFVFVYFLRSGIASSSKRFKQSSSLS